MPPFEQQTEPFLLAVLEALGSCQPATPGQVHAAMDPSVAADLGGEPGVLRQLREMAAGDDPLVQMEAVGRSHLFWLSVNGELALMQRPAR